MEIPYYLAEKLYKNGGTVYIVTESKECLPWCKQDHHPSTLQTIIEDHYPFESGLVFTVQAAVKLSKEVDQKCDG